MTNIYIGQHYRLRAGTPMSVGGRGAGDFVLHSFMASSYTTDTILCTQTLPACSEFRGQQGSLTSASFSSLPLPGGYFKGELSDTERFKDEGEY